MRFVPFLRRLTRIAERSVRMVGRSGGPRESWIDRGERYPEPAHGRAWPFHLNLRRIFLDELKENELHPVVKKFYLLAVLLFGLALPSSEARTPGWAQVPGPASTTRAIIYGSAFVASSDIWAVGSSAIQNTRPLIDHWDGTSWAVSSTLNDITGLLFGAAARSSTDAWAVGQAGIQTLVSHWNGTAWSVISSPNLGSYDILTAVAAISASDVWAVGQSIVPNQQYILMHWDGAAWSLVAAPAAANSSLAGLKAFASDNVWAVGYQNYDANSNTSSTFIMHWDGAVWSVVPSPNADAGNYLNGVDGLAPNDLWAVGYSGNGPSVTHTLALHWDGAIWTPVATRVMGPTDQFYAIKAASPTSIWAVGGSSGTPLTELWTGTRWKMVATPAVGANASLYTITGRGSALWASGRQGYPYTDELFLQSARSSQP